MSKAEEARVRERVRSDVAFAQVCTKRNLSAKNLVREAIAGDVTPRQVLNQVIATRRATNGRTPGLS